MAGKKVNYSDDKCSNSRYYVDPDRFLQEILKSNEKGELTPDAISMLRLMITRIQRPFKYVVAEDREDVASRAMFIVLKEWKKFDTSKKNAFAYFTRIIYNALYDGWNRLNKKKKDTVSIDQIFIDGM